MDKGNGVFQLHRYIIPNGEISANLASAKGDYVREKQSKVTSLSQQLVNADEETKTAMNLKASGQKDFTEKELKLIDAHEAKLKEQTRLKDELKQAEEAFDSHLEKIKSLTLGQFAGKATITLSIGSDSVTISQ